MSHSYTKLLYHIVFATKKRQAWLSEGVQPDLYGVLGGLVRDQGGTALAINGMLEHVHILAGLRQDRTLSAVVGAVKANSSIWLQKQLKTLPDNVWQVGYSAFTVSASQVEVVRGYIVTQKEHHRDMAFDVELLSLLRKHNVEFDDRDLWE
jgi:putative transposase